MFRVSCICVAMLSPMMLAAAASAADQPPVTVSDSADAYTLANGILTAKISKRSGSIESLRTATGSEAWREDLCPRSEAQPAPNRHVDSTIIAALENHGATTHSCSFRCTRVILRNLIPDGMQIMFFITDSIKIKYKPRTRVQGQVSRCEYARRKSQILTAVMMFFGIVFMVFSVSWWFAVSSSFPPMRRARATVAA